MHGRVEMRGEVGIIWTDNVLGGPMFWAENSMLVETALEKLALERLVAPGHGLASVGS